MLEFFKAIIYGIIEGITEWLPISSTGHLILFENLIPMNVSDAFLEMFRVVIQLGAILAVVILYFNKLNPFSPKKSSKEKSDTFHIWGKVIVGCIPAGILGVLFDDWFDAHFYNAYVVAGTLIIYGVLFIVLENYNKKRNFGVESFENMTYKMALAIGLIQCLALIPGTSRSGATILGAMLLGVARPLAAEYSFFLSAPIMAGASLIKVAGFIKDGASMTRSEWGILIIGCVTAFVVSVAAIKFLMSYVRRHDFKVFGYYRIVLGILVLIYFL